MPLNMDWFLLATIKLGNLILSGEAEVHNVVMPLLSFACILIESNTTTAADSAANYDQESANAD